MISFDEVTGHEIRIMDDLCGGRGQWGAGLESGSIDSMYAFVYVARKRNEPTLTFDDVLSLPLHDIVESFTEAADADPTNDATTGTV